MKIVDPVLDTALSASIDFDKQAHPNCSAILFDNLERNPDALAVSGPAGELTYRELCANASAWGRAFKAAGLKRSDRIAFFLDDTPAFPAAFFGAVRAGFVPVLLNTQTTKELLDFFVEDSGARIAICEAEFAKMFDEGQLQTLIVVNGTPPPGAITSSEFLSNHTGDLPMADTGPDDMAFWMYSSGSTGRPKGIVHLHHDMAYTVASYSNHILKVRSDDRLFSAPKLYFAYGFGNGITFPFAAGACAVLMPGQPRANAVLDIIEQYEPTMLFGLPTLYTSLCRSEGASNRNLSSLRSCLSAAEILSEDVFNAWRDLTGLEAIEGLGSTEMLHIYLSNSHDDKRLGSAGRIVAGYEAKLIDPEGKTVEQGVEGAMMVRGHSSAPCYWNRPEKTADTMRGEWLYTGDLFVQRDEAFYFQGRADDLIKVSGQWVWPLEVERCLAEHPQVHECAVLAHELEDKRMTLRAVVNLREGNHTSDETTKDLQNYVKQNLIPYKYPRIIEYVEAMPHTGTGKIDRQALLHSKTAKVT
ncbi:MAG: benzoate-CoA ligase family protein [Nitratireductor sp.]